MYEYCLAQSDLLVARLNAFIYRDFDSVADLYVTLGEMADLHTRDRRFSNAIALHKESLAVTRRLSKLRPDEVLFYQYEWSNLCQIGSLYTELGNVSAASDAFGEGLSRARVVANKFPREASARRDLVFALLEVAATEGQSGNDDLALEYYLEAELLSQQCVKDESHGPYQPNLRALVLRKAADHLQSVGKHEVALDTAKTIVALMQKDLERYPNDLDLAAQFASDKAVLALDLEYFGDIENAFRHYNEVLEFVRITPCLQGASEREWRESLKQRTTERLEAIRAFVERQEPTISWDQLVVNLDDVVLCAPFEHHSVLNDHIKAYCFNCSQAVMIGTHIPQHTKKLCVDCMTSFVHNFEALNQSGHSE